MSGLDVEGTPLIGLGILRADLLTSSVTLNKRYNWRNNRQQFEGCTASTKMSVTVREINALPGICTRLLEEEQLEVYGMSYAHSSLDRL